MSTKNETKLSATHERIYSALLPVAVAIHNAASDIILKPREVQFHFGDPKAFETSKARADLCYIRDRDYCATKASHVYLNPSIGDYAAALAAICAGLVLHYSPDIRARIATAKTGKDSETKLNLIGKLISAMGFKIQGRKSAPKWTNENAAADLAAVETEFGAYPEPVTLPVDSTSKVQGTRRVRLECSAGCDSKVKGTKTPVPVHLYAATSEADYWVGIPCRTRFNKKTGKLTQGCKGTMQPVTKAKTSRKVKKTTKVA